MGGEDLGELEVGGVVELALEVGGDGGFESAVRDGHGGCPEEVWCVEYAMWGEGATIAATWSGEPLTLW